MTAQVLPFLHTLAAPNPRAQFDAARAAFMRAYWDLADMDAATARWMAAEVTTEMLGVLDVGDGA